jgi:hypothetical protein
VHDYTCDICSSSGFESNHIFFSAFRIPLLVVLVPFLDTLATHTHNPVKDFIVSLKQANMQPFTLGIIMLVYKAI